MTQTTVKLSFPTPPSVNTMFRNAGANDRVRHRIKSAAYTKWEKEAMTEIMIQRPPRFDGPVTIDLWHGNLRKNADVSNYIKAIEDVLVKMGIIQNDTREIVVRISSAYNPSLERSVAIISPLSVE